MATTMSAGGTTVTLPLGTKLMDSSGAALNGAAATLTLTSADNSRFLPAAAAALPSNRSMLAFIDLTATDGSKTVKTFSQPVAVALNLTGTGVSAGDAVALYSFDGTSWSGSPEGVVIVDTNQTAHFNMGHLSIWAALRPTSALFRSSAFLADMSNLTKSYIPPLFYTNLPAVNTTQAVAMDAKKSLTRLITVWSDFKTKYKTATEFSHYSAKFDEVDAKIAIAGQIVQTALASASIANDLVAAHEALEVIRQNLLDMDRGNGLDYPIDAIKEFHDGMEPFALAVKGKSATTLTDGDVATLKTMFTVVESTWNKVVVHQVNKDHFGMSVEAKAFIDTATVNQTNNLKALKAALFAAVPDKAVIAANGNNVKPLFLKLFFSFADFLKPFDADLVSADSAALEATSTTAKTAATAIEVESAKSAVAALELSFNKLKLHFATQPISIMGVLTWYTGQPATPAYFDKIGAAIAAAKSQLAVVQAYPADLTAANAQVQVYAVEMAKLKTRIGYQ
ncbi:MAG: hypothetical protein GZ093_20325 [Rhodoferax sp.]|uniref:hypothetical protein n=1 Tax=Rhodoferax sp. TaxID=50421 RepID=UPI00140127BA|nr:hypothetical protein [Rhodoferax sp.]NDP41031.1 hypothetical protein [Rhodoferax sp.]